jgi:NAD(P)-dependent dehydrogenase (short-subunit alcohol dehydrogenase family)
MRELDGKVAFITGGASGLGLALARALGRNNMRVMIADIELPALQAAVTELKKGGIDARGVECDVADRSAVLRAAADCLAAFGKVHVVCANAGVLGGGGPMELIAQGDWDWMINVDLTKHI